MSDDLYIWVNRWDEFQTYQEKRGKKWVPPWIKTYPRQLDDERYYKLTDAQKLLLHELRLVFSSASLWVPFDTSWLCRKLGRKVRKDSIEALNHAGLITICSRTVLERFQDAFWNGSTLEVELEEELTHSPPTTTTPSDDIDFQAADNGGAWSTELDIPRLGDAMPTLGVSE